MNRTPEEIKKGLECDNCKSCPYSDCNSNDGDSHCWEVESDALALIQRLEEEGEAAIRRANILMERVKQLGAEHDVATKALYELCRLAGANVCYVCAHYNDGMGTERCRPGVDKEKCFELCSTQEEDASNQ